MSARRQLRYAVLLCLLGAGVALLAATRVWTVEVTVRPEPLPELRLARTGAAVLAWLPAVALVGLAGAGALLATRSAARRVVGALLLTAGCGVVAGGAIGLITVDRAATGAAAALWPLLCVLGGLLGAAGGTLAVAYGHTWPAMGARYERGGANETGRVERAGPTPTRDVWTALDRGEDPTLR